ncbi:lazarillo protein-like [Bacillus rossius redtenbacheri]|uniref:lazarillo protein-like n=1 Tax=Bacillus rossius redtenbacheri TaxID=93214 RepID=UPI002FDE982E
MLLLLLLLLLLLAAVARCSAVEFAACPDKPATPDFDAYAFQGKWYLVKAHDFPQAQGQPGRLSCIQQVFTANEHGDMSYKIADYDKRTQEAYRWAPATALERENASSDDGKFVIPYPREEDIPVSPLKHYILSTDYINYAIIWGCFTNERANVTLESYFVSSRTRNLSNTEEVDRTIPPEVELHDIDQTDCP